MEFEIRLAGEKVTVLYTTSDNTVVSETPPKEAIRDREQLFTYASRRLQALEDKQLRKPFVGPYKDIDKDSNKAYKLDPAGEVVEKSTNKPAVPKRS